MTESQGRKLSLRQRDILRVLVQEHIASSKPVGSSTVLRIGELDVSSATVRNDLALLEELGYVIQPHTSAGRVPTASGYRYFVEQLMDQVELSMPEQRMIQHQFHQVQLNVDQWMRLTAAVLARATHAASLVTPPHAAHAHFKHIELISIHDTLCLMILVLQDGSIHQEMLSLSNAIGQESLSQISNQLNSLLAQCTVRDMAQSTNAELVGLQGLGRQVLSRVMQIMEEADQRSVRDVYHDGLVNVLNQPEFEDADKVRQVMGILEGRSLLDSVLAGAMDATGIQIIIGGEGSHEEMGAVSLVLSSYGMPDKAIGVLGVLGPMRMWYGRAISTVRYVTQLMDALVDDMYGG